MLHPADRRVFRVAFVAIPALCLLTTCAGNRREPVLAGIQRLIRGWNEGSCRSVYDQADEGFRRRVPQQQWLTRCDEIRNEWGRWAGFDPSYWYSAGAQELAVEGTARFANGRCVLHTIWILDGPRARLSMLLLQNGDKEIAMPPLLRPTPLHLDPPTTDRPPTG